MPSRSRRRCHWSTGACSPCPHCSDSRSPRGPRSWRHPGRCRRPWACTERTATRTRRPCRRRGRGHREDWGRWSRLPGWRRMEPGRLARRSDLRRYSADRRRCWIAGPGPLLERRAHATGPDEGCPHVDGLTAEDWSGQRCGTGRIGEQPDPLTGTALRCPRRIDVRPRGRAGDDRHGEGDATQRPTAKMLRD